MLFNVILVQVMLLRPDFSYDQSHEMAKSISSACIKHKITRCRVFTGILSVESGLRINAVNKRSKDYGIGQVNEWHIKRSKLDKQRLLTDLEYSVNQAAKIYVWFEKTYPIKEAIGRYNCGTRKTCVNWKSVLQYTNKVLVRSL